MTDTTHQEGLAEALGPGKEFDRIRVIARRLAGRTTGVGDDCAVLAPRGAPLCLSVDLSIENIHFRREWLTLKEIGWRATAAALSDLAAEGATPIGVLAAIGGSPDLGDAGFADLMEGVGAAIASVGGSVLGGDLSRASHLVLGITVIGEAARPVTREGAQPGDGVWVTGSLGAPRAALETLQQKHMPTPAAREAFAHPIPRIAAGQWLAANGVHAMLDISDGLGSDARHLAAASGVKLEIDVGQVPVAPDAAQKAQGSGLAPEIFAAVGGEDYELLAALPAGFGPDDAGRFSRDCGLLLTRIGVVQEGSGVIFRHGPEELSLHGFDHFG